MELINKTAVVVEIEKRRSRNAENKLNLVAAFEDNYLLSFLDTLEVKEVDFDEEFRKCHIGIYNPFNSGAEIYEFARHFFELGLKARKGE